MTLRSGGNEARAGILAVPPKFIEIDGGDIIAGRFYTGPEELAGRPVAVIDSSTAYDLYAPLDAVGRTFHMGSQSFRVVGIYKPPTNLLAALGEGPADGGGPGFEGATRPAVGRARIRQDPMIRSERSIQQAVAEAVASSLTEREEKDESRRAELGRMIDSSAIRSVFHPVVSLGDGQVMGHEALTRPTVGCGFVSVEELFAFAESTEMLVDFERLCRTTAIRSATQVESPGLLFLNCSAPAVEDPEWGQRIAAAVVLTSGKGLGLEELANRLPIGLGVRMRIVTIRA